MFEWCPDIRSPKDENFDGVANVLRGSREGVQTLELKPGDLQIFKGRFSLHRVTEIEGPRSRYIALPTFVLDPHSVNRPKHSEMVYGRALPIHHERESQRPDNLMD